MKRQRIPAHRARVLATSVGVLVLALASGGCATPPPARHAMPADTEKLYRLETEGRVPPLEPSAVRREVDHVDTFEEMPVDETGVEVESVEPENNVGPVDAAEDSTVMRAAGYRVQVFATADRARAETVRREAERAVGATAYVDAVGGIFKVRVGDYVSRAQAELLLQRCRRAGYGDAWIVSAQVAVPRKATRP